MSKATVPKSGMETLFRGRDRTPGGYTVLNKSQPLEEFGALRNAKLDIDAWQVTARLPVCRPPQAIVGLS